MPANRRIWASADPFLEGGAVMGRKEANREFLLALLLADPYDAYHFFLDADGDCAGIAGRIRDLCPRPAGRGALVFRPLRELPASMAENRIHCLHLSDAISRFVPVCELRNVYSRHIFPVTGVTHSLSYARFMPEYLRHLRPGVSARDAIIATSRSAEAVLLRVFAGLRAAYGLDEEGFRAPAVELAALGVDLGRLPGPTERWDAPGADRRTNKGRAMRERLEIGEKSPVFLCLSRFSPYSKMDLLPLFAAFKRAEGLGLRPGPDGPALILAGFAEDGDRLPESLQSYARSLGLDVRLFIRPSEDEKYALYAAADIFVSPADNLQETFGLTLAEAGGAGLPVIAPDFDGYRDIVEHGATALLVPALGFAETGESDLQSLFLYDNQYHLKLAQETAIDVPALADALARLGTDPELRRRMGEAGRLRVADQFSWAKVIERLVAIWDGLAARDLPPGEEERLRLARHPLRPRYAEYFSGHFREVLDGATAAEMLVKRTPAGEVLYRGELPLAPYAGLDFFLDSGAVRLLLVAARRETSAADILKSLRAYFGRAGIPDGPAGERAGFTLLWALKHDYLERCRERCG
ncbi:MAG: glycosyltransferase family 4 protein [Desulfovibrio sp.]|jgi:glycosyltransferase involved in cell wall biosynthesis|nr:glycosyltransferase family 4 protein [Desulfovibrio sp.]